MIRIVKIWGSPDGKRVVSSPTFSHPKKERWNTSLGSLKTFRTVGSHLLSTDLILGASVLLPTFTEQALGFHSIRGHVVSERDYVLERDVDSSLDL